MNLRKGPERNFVFVCLGGSYNYFDESASSTALSAIISVLANLMTKCSNEVLIEVSGMRKLTGCLHG